MASTPQHLAAREISSAWWTCPRRDDAAPLRLWCFSPAGHGAAIWFSWTTRFAGAAEIRAARLSGRETRIDESPLTRADALVDALVPEVAARAHQPYALFGHSLGALLAFEVARRLRAIAAPPPVALMVAGAHAPQLPTIRPWIHALPPAEFVAAIEARYGAIAEELRADPSVLELLLPPLRADMEAYETYRHAPAAPLDVPLLALGGLGDKTISRDDVLAWRAQTTAAFQSAFFPSGHFFVQDEPDAVARTVRRFLAEV